MGALIFGLVNTLIASVMERTKEFGMLRALGMNRRTIVLEVVIESVLIMTFGMIFGLVLAYFSFLGLEDGLNLGVWAEGLESFGMSMGPFRMLDLVGLDLGWRARKLANIETPLANKISDELCERDRFGQKNSKGFYNYSEGSRAPNPAPENEEIYKEISTKNNIQRREISDQEIVDRVVGNLPQKKQAMFEPVEGPKPKREVDDARKIIVSQAKEMEKEGAFNLADMMGGGEMIE